jgi:ubiquinone/menaquinone biosynthesis C-methylase UbiE
MKPNSNTKLNNKYVRNYYNKQVGKLDTTYTDSRWHSSGAAEFDYIQTSRALDLALGKDRFEKVVEIGPGDAVWTEKIHKHVEGSMYLIEQSSEMLGLAREKLRNRSDINFELSDFEGSNPPLENDLVIAIRCFEYFQNKSDSIKKMYDMLSLGGRLIIVTKNADLKTSVSVQKRLVHSDQLTRKEMKNLLTKNNFKIEMVYPAVIRWKIKYALMRFVFDTLHKITVWSGGAIQISFLYKYATESFVYVASKKEL